ncbi:WxcM-like domain-containing protein [Dyadobacter sp. SG02]|uniref:WxcM-like domain-containing protein n=1 Tax=Dyadobacter sp. SG02 TaxID=1855291 RepID=UPI0015A511AE
MAKLIALDTFHSDAGVLTVFEKLIPGNIIRVCCLSENTIRTQKKCQSSKALICLMGNCRVVTETGDYSQDFTLARPSDCLILSPCDDHQIHSTSDDCLMLLIAYQ